MAATRDGYALWGLEHVSSKEVLSLLMICLGLVMSTVGNVHGGDTTTTTTATATATATTSTTTTLMQWDEWVRI